METINWDDIKSCYNEMKSSSFPDEGNFIKEEIQIEIKKAIANCKDAMKEKMGKNIKHFINRVKWFLFLPGLILISVFLFTFFLNPEIVQIFWLVITGTLIALGFILILMVSRWSSKIKKQIKA